MRLSRLADYAVVLMTHIAQHPEQVHTAADVSIATAYQRQPSQSS